MWNEDKTLVVKYSKSKDIDVSNFINVLKIPTRILISGDLAYFVTDLG